MRVILAIATVVGFVVGSYLALSMPQNHDTIGEWETELRIPLDPKTVPDPAPEFPFPIKPLIDAFNLIAPSPAHAAAHPVTADPPRENTYLYPSPMKLWTIEQQATDGLCLEEQRRVKVLDGGHMTLAFIRSWLLSAPTS